MQAGDLDADHVSQHQVDVGMTCTDMSVCKRLWHMCRERFLAKRALLLKRSKSSDHEQKRKGTKNYVPLDVPGLFGISSRRLGGTFGWLELQVLGRRVDLLDGHAFDFDRSQDARTQRGK